MLAVVFKSCREDEVALSKVIDDGIDNRADCHLKVTGNLICAAESEDISHALVVQKPTAHQGRGYVIRDHIADHHFDAEAQHTLPRGFCAAEEQVSARDVPNQAAKHIIDNRSKVLAKAAHIEQHEHDTGTHYEIEDTDDQVIYQRSVNHSLYFHKITEK